MARNNIPHRTIGDLTDLFYTPGTPEHSQFQEKINAIKENQQIDYTGGLELQLSGGSQQQIVDTYNQTNPHTMVKIGKLKIPNRYSYAAVRKV